MSGVLAVGLLAVYSAAGILVWFVVAPATGRVPASRRTLPGQITESTLTGATARVSTALEGVVRRRGRARQMSEALGAAGLTVGPGQYLVLVLGGTLGAAAAGVVLGGLPIALLLAVVALVLGWRALPFLAGRRHAKFADQLDGALQLIASSLRAGHSLMRALDAVAREAESPMAEEFSRVVNETKVGRDVGRTIDEAASRNASVDLHWVAQAITIHREVGGNLADVLDGVSATIRERTQIRRQVKALAAEGKLSAYVLMALPIGIFGFLLVTNPSYMGQLLQSGLGIAMLAVAVLLLCVGGFWLSRVVKIKF